MDLNSELRHSVIKTHSVAYYSGLSEVISNDNIDAVVIATNPSAHYDIAKQCLHANKHVLLEKPFTTSHRDSQELVNLAKRNKVKLIVDYTFLYNGAVLKIKEEINKKTFGDIVYVDSIRINLGIFQNDVNVVRDLASHDISILNFLLDKLPVSVKAIGIDSLNNSIENIAYIHLNYDGLFANINCSWSSPVKIRRMLIGGTKKAILYNDLEPSDKVKIYSKGVLKLSEKNKEDILQDYRIGSVQIPEYSRVEPLYKVVDDFYDCIVLNKASASSGEQALKVNKILNAIQQSIKKKNREIKIDWS